MTEDEAKAKWCPFARTVMTDGRSHSMPRNRCVDQEQGGVFADRLVGATCIGSACMAWRWQTEGWVLDFIGNDAVMRKPTYMPEPQGYCGLAGKP